MRCLLFGGGGFIGSAIADRLLADGHAVRIFERPRVVPYRQFAAHEDVEWMTGDVMSAHDVADALEGADVVYHLVSTTLPKNSNDDPVYDVQSNLVSTLHMLNAMVARQVERMIFISSGGTVYGSPQALPIREIHPTDPLVSYGITKLAIEKYLYMYERMHGIRTTVLRVSNPYGERQRLDAAQGALGVFLKKALAGETVDIWGDGSCTRDYIYVRDVAEAFVRVLGYSGKARLFNIGSGQGTSLNQLVDLIEQSLGFPVARRYLPGRLFDVPVNVLCNDLARAELGWLPAVSLAAGIARTASWLKAD